jgi:hypothetical protein
MRRAEVEVRVDSIRSRFLFCVRSCIAGDATADWWLVPQFHTAEPLANLLHSAALVPPVMNQTPPSVGPAANSLRERQGKHEKKRGGLRSTALLSSLHCQSTVPVTNSWRIWTRVHLFGPLFVPGIDVFCSAEDLHRFPSFPSGAVGMEGVCAWILWIAQRLAAVGVGFRSATAGCVGIVGSTLVPTQAKSIQSFKQSRFADVVSWKARGW